VGNLRERDHLEELRVDRRIILEWILKKLVDRKCTGLIWLRVGKSGRGGFRVHVNETWCAIKWFFFY
jgi:hypothetical protein